LILISGYIPWDKVRRISLLLGDNGDPGLDGSREVRPKAHSEEVRRLNLNKSVNDKDEP
jgi:hypothetical protein